MGGQCSKFASMMVGAMNIKPMVNITNGEMAPDDGLRGKRYLDKFLVLVMGGPERIDPKRIFVTHCLSDEAGEVKGKIEREYGFTNVIVADASPATSVYGGSGAVGVM